MAPVGGGACLRWGIHQSLRAMALRCGIVGLPNVGKSSLFNALTEARIAAENYPFCTIEPNSGVVPVPDERLAALDEIVHAKQVIPATVEFTDIAGLVRGASQGEGLGNQFLGHIRETAAIVHVVRCFEDPDVTHVDGAVDPVRDVETIETELALADLESLEKRLDRARRAAKAGKAEDKKEAAFFEALHAHVADGRPARSFEVPREQATLFRSCFLLTAKPILYVANVDEAGLGEDGPHVKALAAHAEAAGAGLLRVCAKTEMDLIDLEPDERGLFLEELGLAEPGLDRLVRAAYALLDLITFLTAGEKEVRAWEIRRGTLAAPGRGHDPHGLRAHVHPGRDHPVRGLRGVRRRSGREGRREDARRGQGVRDAGRRRRALPGGRLVRATVLDALGDVLNRYHDGPRTGVFTDGSCEGNPGPGGWGFVWVENDEVVVEKCGHDPDTTNNRMELTALIEAYRVLPRDAEVTVHSDSRLCVDTINQWGGGLGAPRLEAEERADREPRAGEGALPARE